MPYGPSEAYKHNSKIKTDRHARMWSDVFNSSLKRHNDEGRAFAEANSVVDQDIGRGKVARKKANAQSPTEGGAGVETA